MKRIHVMALLLIAMGVSTVLMSFETIELFSKTQAEEAGGGQEVRDKNGKVLQVRYVRKNAHKDNENMQILADALKKMKEMNCTDPMSWYMQGALHGAPYHGNKFCNGPALANAQNDGWHNCTHDYESLGLDADNARMHFYTWHKMYLSHFEDMVRKVSGRPDFSIPYWEYDNPNYQTLPDLLKDKSSSLYEAFRNDHVNQGNKLQTNFFSKANNPVQDFTNPKDAFDSKGFYHFTRDLESVPHNKIHVYLGLNPTARVADTTVLDPIGQGPYGYMIQMYSPMDPVFWIHHANIDRLYEKWLIEKIDDKINNGGRPQKSDFIVDKWPYRFFEVGKNKITYYKDLNKVFNETYGVQNYAYDMFIKSGQYNQKYEKKVNKAIATGQWGKKDFQVIELLAASYDKDIAIGGRDTTFTLNLNPRRPKLAKVRQETWALKMDVEFTKAPEGIFWVYIKDQKNQRVFPPTDDDNIGAAGSMTFFGAGHSHGGSGARHDNHNHQKLHEIHFDFDVRSEEIDFDTFSGDMTFYIQSSNPNDRVSIDKIQLVRRSVIKTRL